MSRSTRLSTRAIRARIIARDRAYYRRYHSPIPLAGISDPGEFAGGRTVN